jgi:anti-sigma B factor antagonist
MCRRAPAEHRGGRLSEMAPDNEPTTDQVLFVSSSRDGNRTVVKLVGELDLHGTDQLTAEVQAALSAAAEIVEIDAESLTFADSAGLRAVLLARAEAMSTGAVFRLVSVSPSVGRVIEIAGLADELLPTTNAQ